MPDLFRFLRLLSLYYLHKGASQIDRLPELEYRVWNSRGSVIKRFDYQNKTCGKHIIMQRRASELNAVGMNSIKELNKEHKGFCIISESSSEI